MDHDKFIDCNLNNKNIEISQRGFRSINHQIYTTLTTKLGISNTDNKRNIDNRFDNNTYTIPIGYNKLIDSD